METEKMKQVEAFVVKETYDVVSTITAAENGDQVASVLRSLASSLFPAAGGDEHSFAIQEIHGSDWFSIVDEDEMRLRRMLFYRGIAFPTLARTLLHDVALKWLLCFSEMTRKHVYDVFFVQGLCIDVVKTVVPYLCNFSKSNSDSKIIHKNVKRILVLCLVKNNGVLNIVREFTSFRQQFEPDVDKVAQLITSIPDKALSEGKSLLSPYPFFKKMAIQLLLGAEECYASECRTELWDQSNVSSVPLVFFGATFSRICRRGSTDILVKELVPNVLKLVQGIISENAVDIMDAINSRNDCRFWVGLMETIKDAYAIEKLSELILRQIFDHHANDEEAFWVLRILFGRVMNNQSSVRSLFIDKFLLWKVFSVRCLSLILNFAVFERSPNGVSLFRGEHVHHAIDVLHQLALVWSKREFVQSTLLHQQAYVSAALGFCLERISKEEFDKTKNLMQSILHGISCRLESPDDMIRRMAACIAYMLSKVITPEKPLYLHDCCRANPIDWEFMAAAENKPKLISSAICRSDDSTLISQNVRTVATQERFQESVSADHDDYSSENSDSSLQPYDLSDDDSDLERNISQLVDISGALRKPDDVDGVEKALDVAETLIRAMPDELPHISRDLAKALVHVRCSDATVDGDDCSAETKRQKALTALLVVSPFEVLESLNKLLISPNVDMSQRVLILDVMSEAAEELSTLKWVTLRNMRSPLISSFSDPQPWFIPSSTGPLGSSPWAEVPSKDGLLKYSQSYERELPSKPGQALRGKTRRWSHRSGTRETQIERSLNAFPEYAAAFMLPVMQEFDKKRHGFDLLGRDFVVLGKLIHMLGVCIKCAALHPEASVLALPLLDLLRSREVCQHTEAYVRRCVLFAATSILEALHPSFVAHSLTDRNPGIVDGLDWIRTWSLYILESDTDRDCYVMGMRCLQLHAELALEASRKLESVEFTNKVSDLLPLQLSEITIQIPHT